MPTACERVVRYSLLAPSVRETDGVRIREHLEKATGADLPLHRLPPLGGEEVGVETAEALARLRIGEQEGLELLGKHVVRPHGIPDVARHLVPAGRHRRDLPEVAVDEVLDLVV